MAFIIINSNNDIFKVVVDNDDFYKVVKYKWHINFNLKKHKPKAFINGKWIFLSRFIMNINDRNLTVDHINHDLMDNRKKNLRLASIKENNRNKRPQKNKTSKYKGVHKDCNRFYAEIKLNGKSIHLGSFINEEDAAQAYNDMALKHYGEFAYLNKIS